MSASATNEALVSTAEIESVLAQAAAAGENIPSLDEAVAVVPVELPPLPGRDFGGVPTPTRADETPGPQPVDGPAAPAPDDTPAVAGGRRIRSLPDVAYALLDGTLGFLDWPLRRAPHQLKTLIFAASAASAAMSVAAALTFPVLFPARDLAKEVHAKALSVEAARHAAAQTASTGEHGSANAQEAASAHGDAPKPAAGH